MWYCASICATRSNEEGRYEYIIHFARAVEAESLEEAREKCVKMVPHLMACARLHNMAKGEPTTITYNINDGFNGGYSEQYRKNTHVFIP